MMGSNFLPSESASEEPYGIIIVMVNMDLKLHLKYVLKNIYIQNVYNIQIISFLRHLLALL